MLNKIFHLCLADKEVNAKNVIAVFTNELSPGKYCQLGLALELTLTTIEKIEADYPFCGRRIVGISQAWIDQCTSCPSEKWKTLAQALVDIKEITLAEKIVILH